MQYKVKVEYTSLQPRLDSAQRGTMWYSPITTQKALFKIYSEAEVYYFKLAHDIKVSTIDNSVLQSFLSIVTQHDFGPAAQHEILDLLKANIDIGMYSVHAPVYLYSYIGDIEAYPNLENDSHWSEPTECTPVAVVCNIL